MTAPVRVDRTTLPPDVQSALAELGPLITASPLLGDRGLPGRR